MRRPVGQCFGALAATVVATVLSQSLRGVSGQQEPKSWQWTDFLGHEEEAAVSAASVAYTSMPELRYVPVKTTSSLLQVDLSEGNEAATTRMHELMERFGVAVIPGVLTATECSPFRSELLQQVLQSSQDGDMGTDHRHNEVRETTTASGKRIRFDEPLLFDPDKFPAVAASFIRLAAVTGDALSQLLGGENATMLDFTSIIPFPGAVDQGPHPDQGLPSYIRYGSGIPGAGQDQRFVSTFLFAVDVTVDGGALDVWPGTHSNDYYEHKYSQPLDQEHESLLHHLSSLPPAVRMALPAGSAVMYDSRLWHQGSANTKITHASTDTGAPENLFSGAELREASRPSMLITWKSTFGTDPGSRNEFLLDLTSSMLPFYRGAVKLVHARIGVLARSEQAQHRVNRGCRTCHWSCALCWSGSDDDQEVNDACGFEECTSCYAGFDLVPLKRTLRRSLGPCVHSLSHWV